MDGQVDTLQGGFGAAAARALAGAGMNIFGVHLDTKTTLSRAQQVVADVRALGREVLFCNSPKEYPEKAATSAAPL